MFFKEIFGNAKANVRSLVFWEFPWLREIYKFVFLMHSGHFVNRNNLLKIGLLLLLLLLLLLYLKRFGDMLYKKLSRFVCFHFFFITASGF